MSDKLNLNGRVNSMKKHLLVLAIASLALGGCSSKLTQNTVVTLSEQDGLLRDDGKLTIKPMYKKINRFDGSEATYSHPNYVNLHWLENKGDNTYAIVENNEGKFGVIDNEGNLLVKVEYDSIGRFYNGFAQVELDNKLGLINEKFEVVIKPIYEETLEFVYDSLIVKQFGKYGCIDKNLELKIEPSMDMIYLQHEGFKRVQQANKWGFVDQDCEFLVKPSYDYAYDFHNGFAKVKVENGWKFIDINANFLIEKTFDDADQF